MHVSSTDPTQSSSSRGPAVYFGYCGRTGRYHMMDLPEYLSNLQEGVSNLQQGISRWFSDSATIYQDVLRRYSAPAPGGAVKTAPGRVSRRCGCDDCHCECCVCDADVLLHARCGEIRRIPVTFENETRREQPVKAAVGKFLTAGGRDLGWNASLSETDFTLPPCGEHTVTVTVQVRCETSAGANEPPGSKAARKDRAAAATDSGAGSVDHCEVGYANLSAEGCLVRPVVLAVAVLPDDCDAYRRPCGCGCCH
jgi:hypothetical protein